MTYLIMDNLLNQITTEKKKLETLFSSQPSNYVPASSFSLAQTIDHTLLKPDATIEQINKLCSEAVENDFYAICISPAYILHASKRLKDTDVKIATVVGFPTGATTTESKVFETLDAIDCGAHEIDMVINIGKLKSGLLEDVYQDIVSVVGQAEEIPVKVILETCLLNTEEKIRASLLAQMAGAAYLKTSTGFSTGGATVEDIQLMKLIVENTMGIKASGGIKNVQTALQMIEAGAVRLGTSSGVSIIEEENGNKKSK